MDGTTNVGVTTIHIRIRSYLVTTGTATDSESRTAITCAVPGGAPGVRDMLMMANTTTRTLTHLLMSITRYTVLNR
jgi:hypothetical protein